MSGSAATVSGRGSVSIMQLPAAENDFTLIARFADGANGSAGLRGQITVTAVPEPAIASLLLAGLGVLLMRKKASGDGQQPAD